MNTYEKNDILKTNKETQKKLSYFNIIIIIFSVFLVSCKGQIPTEIYDSFNDVNSEFIEIKEDDFVDFTDKEMNEIFRKQFGLYALQDHSLSYGNKMIFLKFYFPSDINSSEIYSARNYIILNMLNGKRKKYLFPDSYEELRRNNEVDDVLLNIYANDELLIQDYYDQEMNEKHYESVDINIPAREVKSSLTDDVVFRIKKNTNVDVEVLKSFVRDGIYVKIEGKKRLNVEDLERIYAVSSELENEFTRVILKFYDEKGLYYDAFYKDGILESGDYLDKSL